MDTTESSLDFSGAFHLLLNTLVVAHLSDHYSVCVIRGLQDDIRLEFSRATVNLLMEGSNSSDTFDDQLIHAINAGCEGFVITESTLFPFLDNFRTAHEAAFFRAFNKRIIAVTPLESAERNRLMKHDTMEVIPNILFIVPNVTYRWADLYTTSLLPAEPRGVKVELLRLERILLGRTYSLPVMATHFPDKFSDMQGRRLRLSTLPYPPCTVVNEVPLGYGNARSTMPTNQSLLADGTEILMVLEFCRRHNCTLEIELFPSSDWGQLYPNGSADGLIGSIINRRADVAVAAIYRWYNWYTYVCMSAYIGRSGVSILVPRPRLLPHWQTPFLTFPSSLWLMVSGTFCVGSVAVFVTERYRQRIHLQVGAGQRYRILDAIFFMISLFVEQSAPLHNDMLAGTILLGFLLFGGFMIGNSYAGALSSVMTIPRYEKSIDTRADFTEVGMKMVGSSIAWMYPLLMTEQPELVTIRDHFEVYDETILRTFLHTRRDLGHIHERLQYGSYALESYIDINATRLLQPLKEDIMWELVITACSKTWPMMNFFDDLVLRVQQNGILRYWEIGSVIRNMGLEIQRIIANARIQDTDHEPVNLSIAHFLGVFFILLVGLSLAFIAFITELAVCWKKQKC